MFRWMTLCGVALWFNVLRHDGGPRKLSRQAQLRGSGVACSLSRDGRLRLLSSRRENRTERAHYVLDELVRAGARLSLSGRPIRWTAWADGNKVREVIALRSSGPMALRVYGPRLQWAKGPKTQRTIDQSTVETNRLSTNGPGNAVLTLEPTNQRA